LAVNNYITHSCVAKLAQLVGFMSAGFVFHLGVVGLNPEQVIFFLFPFSFIFAKDDQQLGISFFKSSPYSFLATLLLLFIIILFLQFLANT